MSKTSSWHGFYRGFNIEHTSKGWEVRTGIARTIHPHKDFQALYSEREKRERVYLTLLATRKTRRAARAFADAKLAREVLSS